VVLTPNDQRVRDFLRSSMIVEVATLSPKRRPFVTPLWFVAHRGAFYITTGVDSWAGKNVAQHPAVTLLFRGEPARCAEPVLRVRGTATINRNLPPWVVLLRVATKYYLGRGLRVELRHRHLWGLRRRYYAQATGGPGFIKVIPATCEFLETPPGD
jgi:hypothetical protein